MDQDLFQKIYTRHLPHLKHLDVVNNTKMLICFSGVAGVGKTTVATLLEERYRGVRINNDDIRAIMEELGIPYHVSQAPLQEYLIALANRIAETKNGLIILDSSIDRKYDMVRAWVDEHNMPMYIIRMEAARETIHERIKNRNKEAASDYLRHMNVLYRDYEQFNATHKANFVLNNDGSLSPDPLLRSLDLLL